MILNPNAVLRQPDDSLTNLIRAEGRLRVLRALIASMFRDRPPRPMRVSGLSPHLLRDIGIGPDFGTRRGQRD